MEQRDIHFSDSWRDRALGVIFGQAVGDALGRGTEFMRKDEVKKFYPDGLWRFEQIVRDRHRRLWQMGEWSDDTDMMRCVMSAIVEQNGRVDYMSIAAKFKQWAMNGARGMGQTTYNLMMMGDYAERPFKAAELVWRMGRCDNAPNGSVMRTAVVGLLRHDVARHAENIGRLTHFDPRCVGACVVVSELVHALVYEERVLTPADVMALAQQYDERIAAYVEKAAAGNLSSLELDDPLSMGYVLKTMGAAFWACWHADRFDSGLQTVVGEGGDADTNAAVAGAVMGARFGNAGLTSPEGYDYVGKLLRRSVLESEAEAFLRVLAE